tara:strand:+ start:824 stop:1012 length:189 start_codon:yes stop_codon:yes gene_type:complete
MTLYKCVCGEEKEVKKATLVLRDNEWITKEALCYKCNKYMDSEPLEGIPSLKRTEETLRKSK